MAYTPASVSTAPSTMMKSEEVTQKKPGFDDECEPCAFLPPHNALTSLRQRKQERLDVRTDDNDGLSSGERVLVQQELRQAPNP
jgi:hypothetical protein